MTFPGQKKWTDRVIQMMQTRPAYSPFSRLLPPFQSNSCIQNSERTVLRLPNGIDRKWLLRHTFTAFSQYFCCAVSISYIWLNVKICKNLQDFSCVKCKRQMSHWKSSTFVGKMWLGKIFSSTDYPLLPHPLPPIKCMCSKFFRKFNTHFLIAASR